MVYLISKFQEVYTPSKFISIGEELLLHKGKLKFKQYIRSKHARFGISFFSLCEDSGYLWNSDIHIGKEINNTYFISPDLSKSVWNSESIVIRLLHPLLGMGYKLFWTIGTHPQLFFNILLNMKLQHVAHPVKIVWNSQSHLQQKSFSVVKLHLAKMETYLP